MLLEISQNWQENTSTRVARASFLIKSQTHPLKYLKWYGLLVLWHRCFPAKFGEFQAAAFFTEHLWTTVSVVSAYLWDSYYEDRLTLEKRMMKTKVEESNYKLFCHSSLNIVMSLVPTPLRHWPDFWKFDKWLDMMKQTCLRQKVLTMMSRLAFPYLSLRYCFLWKVTYNLSNIEEKVKYCSYNLLTIDLKLRKSLPKIP